ncbi:DUF2922 domain-containing protein [Sedimentibacter sp.]|uniref:DUF2922 domain-containing protein n=1 Tax=Sedimentibacter sp. TaxID=1960295 RepID=UPI0028ADD004|nr:DUF2922 domain-containing protein [Sedimentibacter sp.]
MDTKLVMSFKCAEGGTFSCNIDDPLDDLTAVQVAAVMDNMIAADAFDIKGGLREKVSAEIVTITTNKLF